MFDYDSPLLEHDMTLASMKLPTAAPQLKQKQCRYMVESKRLVFTFCLVENTLKVRLQVGGRSWQYPLHIILTTTCGTLQTDNPVIYSKEALSGANVTEPESFLECGPQI